CRTGFRQRLRVYRAVIAAWDAGMALVAGNHQRGVIVAGGVCSIARDFAAIVDECRFLESYQIRTRNGQVIQVNHGAAVLPEEAVAISLGVLRSSNDLPEIVDAFGFSESVGS